MPHTFVADRQALLKICNALNAEAAAFDVHSKNLTFPSDSRMLLHTVAEENRALVVDLLNQWERR